jgi:hypothetical protein
MIPNLQIAMEALVEIKDALAFTPVDWTTAQRVCEDSLDFSTFPLFQSYEPGQALARGDTRVDELSQEVGQLQRALKARDLEAAGRLLASIKRRVEAMAAESAVV